MKTAIRERALELGFDACQFTTARPPGSAGQFQRWLEAGRHGRMAYLERNACKRIEPGQVLAAARSIITLAASYAGDEPRAATASQKVGRAVPCPPQDGGATLLSQPSQTAGRGLPALPSESRLPTHYGTARAGPAATQLKSRYMRAFPITTMCWAGG